MVFRATMPSANAEILFNKSPHAEIAFLGCGRRAFLKVLIELTQDNVFVSPRHPLRKFDVELHCWR